MSVEVRAKYAIHQRRLLKTRARKICLNNAARLGGKKVAAKYSVTIITIFNAYNEAIEIFKRG